MEKKGDVEVLMKALGHEKEDVRRAAALALGNLGDARAVEPLIKMLKDKDSLVRLVTATALGDLTWEPSNDTENVYYLIAKKEWWKLEGLGKQAVEPLIQVLEDEDWDVRCSVAKTLRKIGDDRAVEPLIQALKDEDWRVRRDAAWALGNIGDARAVEYLIQALKDKEEQVREAAKDALERIRTKKS